MSTPNSAFEKLIRDYLEWKEKSIQSGKKKFDAEREYNKLLAKYSAENREYTLAQAEKIYAMYLDMTNFREESQVADARFIEIEEKLREAGEALFATTITAELSIASSNGEPPATKIVTISYNNGQVIVSARTPVVEEDN